MKLNQLKKINKSALVKTLKGVSKIASKKLLKHYEKNFQKGGFDSESSGNFERWSKRKHKRKHPILKKTKKLQKGFKSGIVKNGFKIYNTTPYGQFHQEGTENMDARPIITWSKESEKIVLDEIEKQVLKMLGL